VLKFKPGGLQNPNITIKIMGIIRDFEYNIGVYVALPFVQKYLADPIHYFTSISVVLNENSSTQFINSQLSRSEVSFIAHIQNIRGVIDRIVNAQIFIVAITVFLGFLIAFISVFNTQYISLIERDRDISIQMAFGFSRSYFLKEFLLEILLIVPISVVIAIFTSVPLAYYFLGLIEEATIRMDYFLGNTEILFSFLFVLITAFSAAVSPAFYFVNTKRIAKMLRAEE
jgi:ABC-type antimicrobial peptide transport system permease subunit